MVCVHITFHNSRRRTNRPMVHTTFFIQKNLPCMLAKFVDFILQLQCNFLFSPLSSVSTLALSFHRRVSFDFSASTDWTNAVGVHVHRIGCGATAAARRVRRKARIFSSVTHLGRWAWLTGRQREISDRFVHKRAKPRSQAQLWPRGVVADLVRLVLSVQFENHGERRSGCLLSD